MKKTDGKKLIAGISLFLIVLMALLLKSFTNYNQALIEQQQQQLLKIVRSVSRTMETYIDNQKTALEFFIYSEGFRQGLTESVRQNDDGYLEKKITEYLEMDSTARAEMFLVDETGEIYFKVHNQASALTYKEDFFEFSLAGIEQPVIPGIYLAAERNYLLPIVMAVEEASPAGKQLYSVLLIDFEDIYRRIDSTSIKADEKSYLIVKNQDGYIILHESREQIGIHAILGRAERYPEVDFTGMNSLIEKEMLGNEDTYIFDSYWFADNEPLEKARKFSAFTPLDVDYGFWIVSINMDYGDFLAPFNKIIFTMIALLVMIAIVFCGIVLILFKSQKERQNMAKETAYLRELNTTLDELNQTKERTRHSEKLQLIGIMTSGIAHEFNNILSPIMGYSELLLAELPEASVYCEDVQEIYDASNRAKELVQQISALSHRESERMVYEAIDIGEKLQRWIKSAVLMKPENIFIETDIAFNETYTKGNATQIYEVLLNLCTNSFYAMKEKGGTLKISGQVVSLEALPDYLRPIYPEPEYILIQVQDSGTGMDEETLAKIFTPFFSTKKQGEGTGLGLSIAQGIIEEHHGAIGGISKLGRGTTLGFCLPITTERGAITGGALDVALSGQKAGYRKILFVDDDQSLIKVMSRTLQRKGYQLTAFRNPAEALAAFRQAPYEYNVLITDYTMDMMNGVELAIQIRRLAPEIKIIVISGLIKKNILNAYKQEIIDAYMMKPVKIEELINLLQ